MHLLLISDKRRDKITTTTPATRGASMLSNGNSQPLVPNYFLLRKATLRTESLIILVTHQTRFFSPSCLVRRLTISLLMCKIYRSILFIWEWSSPFFWFWIVEAFPKLFSSSSITDGHWLTTYTLLTIVSLSWAWNYCCIIFFFLFYLLHLLNTCVFAIAHLFAIIHEN